jgi:hypothetical protein
MFLLSWQASGFCFGKDHVSCEHSRLYFTRTIRPLRVRQHMEILDPGNNTHILDCGQNSWLCCSFCVVKSLPRVHDGDLRIRDVHFESLTIYRILHHLKSLFPVMLPWICNFPVKKRYREVD